MNMFSFFKKQPLPKFTGALIDNRRVSEKIYDVRFKEIVAKSAQVVWREKNIGEIRKFPEFNQYSTSSCVANMAAKILGIYYQQKYNYFIKFSPAYIYNLRWNKGQEGMWAYDLFNILKTKGAAFYDLLPTPKTETELNSLAVLPHMIDAGKVFSITSEVVVDAYYDIDTIASIIQQTNKGVGIWIWSAVDEWSLEKPVILHPELTRDKAQVIHAISAVDFTLKDGEKTLVIEDSAWFGGINRRYITEKFLKQRCFYAAYFMNFKFEGEENNKPHYTFNKDLYFGMEKDTDVAKLQDILKYEQLFPQNIESTGNFYSITLNAVKAFQTKYNISPISGYVGPITRNKLNELYG